MSMADYGVVDYTPLMALKPRTENFIEKLGIFSQDSARYIDQRYAEFEREELGMTDMYNVARGADRQFIGSEQARKEIIETPYATLDGVTVPSEVEAFRQYGTENETASIASVVERKIQHIQRSHAKYIRDVQYTALVGNKIHAKDKAGNEIPSLAKNFSTLWGANRKTGTVNLGDDTVNPYDILAVKRQEIIDAMGENTGFTAMVLLAPTPVFNGLVGHPLVVDAYAGRDGGARFMTERLGASPMYQEFNHKGIILIEDTSGKLTAGTGHMLPLGVDGMFDHVFSPAYTLDHVNQVSQGSYLFMKEDWRQHVIESELAYACMISRPELICDLTFTL